MSPGCSVHPPHGSAQEHLLRAQSLLSVPGASALPPWTGHQTQAVQASPCSGSFPFWFERQSLCCLQPCCTEGTRALPTRFWGCGTALPRFPLVLSSRTETPNPARNSLCHFYWHQFFHWHNDKAGHPPLEGQGHVSHSSISLPAGIGRAGDTREVWLGVSRWPP